MAGFMSDYADRAAWRHWVGRQEMRKGFRKMPKINPRASKAAQATAEPESDGFDFSGPGVEVAESDAAADLEASLRSTTQEAMMDDLAAELSGVAVPVNGHASPSTAGPSSDMGPVMQQLRLLNTLLERTNGLLQQNGVDLTLIKEHIKTSQDAVIASHTKNTAEVLKAVKAIQSFQPAAPSAAPAAGKVHVRPHWARLVGTEVADRETLMLKLNKLYATLTATQQKGETVNEERLVGVIAKQLVAVGITTAEDTKSLLVNAQLLRQGAMNVPPESLWATIIAKIAEDIQPNG
jgi:hypothetical protein